jgi:glycosyltransferase involved in cell wall biosynthesis
VSAVVPTCDREQTLATCLRSVLSQDVELEVVVVDDGHTDAARRVCEDLTDTRVRLVSSDRSRNTATARNVGIMAARGRWIAFCDDDDLWAPHKLRSLLDVLDRTDARWGCSGAIIVDATLDVIGHERLHADDLEQIGSVNVIPGGGSNVVVRRDLIEVVGWFDQALTNSEDWDYSIRLATAASPAVVDEPLVAYRRWDSSKSTDPTQMRRAITNIVAKAGPEAGKRSSVYPRDRYLANLSFRSGGRLRGAAAYLELALRHRRPSDAGRALAALAAPATMARHDRSSDVGRIPAGWIDASDAWLCAYRTSPSADRTDERRAR